MSQNAAVSSRTRSRRRDEASAVDGDASTGNATAVERDTSEEVGRADGSSEPEMSVAATNPEPQDVTLQHIVGIMTGLGEKMDNVRQEMTDNQTAVRRELQGDICRLQQQITAANQRMDQMNQIPHSHVGGNEQMNMLSPEAQPFVPVEQSVPVMTRKQPSYLQKVPRYDGKAVWEAYLAQFSILAQGNNWSDEEKAFYLSTSLEGQALTLLATMAERDRCDYWKLVSALESRFGVQHQQQQSRVLLSTLKKKPDVSLQAFVESLKHHVMLAYPNASSEIQDALALHHLTTAMDTNTQAELLRRKPQTLQDALEVVATEEAINSCYRKPTTAPVRVVEAEKQRSGAAGSADSSVGELSEVISEFKSVLQMLKRQLPQTHRKTTTEQDFSGSCWYCQERGHQKRHCGKWRADMEKNKAERREQQEN